MKKSLQGIQRLLRRMHLLPLVEKVRYRMSLATYGKRMKAFAAEHPDFVLPPPHLAFDAFSAPDWDWYKQSGGEIALELKAIVDQHFPGRQDVAVLEWGCGPARIIRHLPGALGSAAAVYGADYNPESIEWCRTHIPNITFETNGLLPPFPFEDDTFDLVYAISVFTHLAEDTSRSWVEEIRRVLNPGGLLLFSNNGDHYREYLVPAEREAYDARGFVVRGDFEEGKKMYTAFHTPDYTRRVLLDGFEVVAHTPSGTYGSDQDLWLVRKPV